MEETEENIYPLYLTLLGGNGISRITTEPIEVILNELWFVQSISLTPNLIFFQFNSVFSVEDSIEEKKKIFYSFILH